MKDVKIEEIQEVILSSSSSSEYDDSDDEYKNIKPRKYSSVRKKSIEKTTWKKQKIGLPSPTIERKIKLEEEDVESFVEKEQEADLFTANTFAYVDDSDNLRLENFDEAAGFENSEEVDKSNEQLLEEYMSNRQYEIIKTRNLIRSVLPNNPFIERLVAIKSSNQVSGRCQNIKTSLPTEIDEDEEEVETKTLVDVWDQPFENLVCYNNIVNVDVPLKETVQNELSMRLEKRKSNLLDQFMQENVRNPIHDSSLTEEKIKILECVKIEVSDEEEKVEEGEEEEINEDGEEDDNSEEIQFNEDIELIEVEDGVYTEEMNTISNHQKDLRELMDDVFLAD